MTYDDGKLYRTAEALRYRCEICGEAKCEKAHRVCVDCRYKAEYLLKEFNACMPVPFSDIAFRKIAKQWIRRLQYLPDDLKRLIAEIDV